jgi:RecB family exonuclease
MAKQRTPAAQADLVRGKQDSETPSQPWQVLAPLLAEASNAFVFPSEVTARFWARRALELGGRRTVILDRFLSWDELKIRLLVYPEGRRPVNRAGRLLFLYRFLEDNRRTPRLQRLVPVAQAGTPLPYLAALERILPALHHVPRLRWLETSRSKSRDLLLLHREYARHLLAAGLYEPAWERPVLRKDGRSYWIFWPELIEDYQEYARILESASWLHTVPVPPPPPGPAVFRAYPTVSEELKAVLSEAAALLDAGVDADRIAITVGGLSEIEGALLRQAELYQVPLAIRHGGPVDCFPTARLFSRLFACHESGLSLSAFKDLLLDRAIPWRQEQLARALVRLGIEGKVLANRGTGDAWLEALQRAASHPMLRALPLARLEGYYRSLGQAIRGAALSTDFRELKERLAVLAGEFLDLGRWSGEEMEVYQFCLERLDDLEAETAAAPLPASLPAWKVWLEYLSRLWYVPRRPGGGIPVYPYRVAAGIRPDHHLLIGISQAATLYRLRRYPFLAVHEEQGLEDALTDLSAAYLRLYCHSGSQVSFRYARHRQGRTHLPPAYFVAAGVVAAQTKAPSPTADPYEIEADAWKADRKPPLGFPHEPQARGYAAARRTVLHTRELDVTRGPLQDPALVRRLFARLTGEGGQLRLSATALESFAACPLRFLFERALGLGEETYEPVLEDPRDIGRVLHGVVQRFFTKLLEAGVETLVPGQVQAYRQALDEAVAAECHLFEAVNPATLRPVWQALRFRVQELAEAYLERELTEMAGARTLQVEAWLQAPLPAGQAVLVGKIDRIASGPAVEGGCTLVEYKKNRLPTRPAIFGPEPTSFQVPFYAHLLEAQGCPVTRALYYSFQQKRFRAFVREGNANERRQLATASAAVLERLRSMSERLRSGDFSAAGAAGDADTGCAGCPFPGLCRTRYVLES